MKQRRAAALTSTTILLVSMNVLLKYLRASAASSADLKPMKPNCLDAPSLQITSQGFCLQWVRERSHCCQQQMRTYRDLTTLASVTSPFTEKCSRSRSSPTYFGRPLTHSLLVILMSRNGKQTLRCCDTRQRNANAQHRRPTGFWQL